LGAPVLRFWLVCWLAVFAGSIESRGASYLDENPDEVFAGVYSQLGIKLPVQVAREPDVWATLDQLKRESCDQKSIGDLALLLDRLGYRREAALAPYNFVKRCGQPVLALHKSIDLLLKLSDYALALEVADEFMRRAPTNFNAHYLRGVALEAIGDYKRALVDYADAVELFNDKRNISSRVFLRMANCYAKLERFCEAASPIMTWIALDPIGRDTSKTRKIVEDYEQQGNCAVTRESQKERFAARGGRVILAKGEVNGVRGTFIIDTGASYVSLKLAFAERAKVSLVGASEITLSTANGRAKGRLTHADAVALGRLRAANVPVVVQNVDDTSYGSGVDGLLGMSFLSRFDLQMSGGFLEIRTRGKK